MQARGACGLARECVCAPVWFCDVRVQEILMCKSLMFVFVLHVDVGCFLCTWCMGHGVSHTICCMCHICNVVFYLVSCLLSGGLLCGHDVCPAVPAAANGTRPAAGTRPPSAAPAGTHYEFVMCVCVYVWHMHAVACFASTCFNCLFKCCALHTHQVMHPRSLSARM